MNDFKSIFPFIIIAFGLLLYVLFFKCNKNKGNRKIDENIAEDNDESLAEDFSSKMFGDYEKVINNSLPYEKWQKNKNNYEKRNVGSFIYMFCPVACCFVGFLFSDIMEFNPVYGIIYGFLIGVFIGAFLSKKRK